MTDLRAALARLIEHDGPIPVSRFMAEANRHYYATRDPFGIAGDFITAPEISQMFGELIGLWALQVWIEMGRPAPFCLAELGPGRGTLMADALRAAKVRPEFIAAAQVHLIETSPTLRARQRAALADATPTWHDSIDSLPALPLILIANEFFDALPIRQFVRGRNGWHERLIGLDAQGKLTFMLAPDVLPHVGATSSLLATAAAGSVAEICPAACAIAEALAERIARHGGAALIIDYGPPASGYGDTLQAVRAHAYHGALQSPGDADLTAHVDFAALIAAANTSHAQVWRPVPQGMFLRRLGIEARAAALIAGATPQRAAEIAAARDRLTGDDAMGTLFQALAFTHPALPAPPGFAS
jgi:NADH dehydrogenase [ubiquinone] 1 alpha subcomplex assembly factor 7